jgi:streptogramin lyase
MNRTVIWVVLALLPCAICTVHAAEDADLAARIAQLVKDLDADDFVTRENATNTLLKIGKPAVEALKKALASRPSAEAAKRIQDVLAQIDPPPRRDNQAISPDGKLTAVGDGNNVSLLDQATGKSVRVFMGHKGKVTTTAFSPDGRLLASGSADGSVIVWDPVSGKMLYQMATGAEFTSVKFSPDGSTLTCKTTGNAVYVVESATGNVIDKFVEGER